jgi:hypothetical protein
MPTRNTKDWAWIVLLTVLLGLAASAHAADDTKRFYGSWKATFPYNGRTVTMVSVHNANGVANYILLPSGYSPAGNGTFPQQTVDMQPTPPGPMIQGPTASSITMQ